MSHPLVVNFRDPKAEWDIFVARPSRYGNPFIIGRHGNREQVLNMFKTYFDSLPPYLKEIWKIELKGRRLACFCSPLPCHADILAEFANQ